MKFILILLLSISLASCNDHVNVDLKGDGKNACFVDAVTYKAAYDAQYQLKPYKDSKILAIQWSNPKTKINGHVVVIFVINTQKEFPAPKYNRCFAWDRTSGAQEVPINLKDTPYYLACHLFGKERVARAFFL